MDELRRRRIVAPGPSVVERLVAAVLVVAERHVAGQLTRNLSPAQTEALDALLVSKEGTLLSVLGWARQPPGPPGHKALARIVDQLTHLRSVALDPACADGVHPERLRKLAREGGRYTAQHLRALSLLRRRATLVATVLDTMARVTDDGVGAERPHFRAGIDHPFTTVPEHLQQIRRMRDHVASTSRTLNHGGPPSTLPVPVLFAGAGSSRGRPRRR